MNRTKLRSMCVLVGLRNRVEAARVEWVAAQDAPGRQNDAAQRAVRLNGLRRIGRATRRKAALAAEDGGQGASIAANGKDEQRGNCAPHRRSSPASSRAMPSALSRAAPGRTIKTRSVPGGRAARRRRYQSRNRRFTRLRATALPTRWLTAKPRPPRAGRAVAPVAGRECAICATKCALLCRRPARRTRMKSLELRSLSARRSFSSPRAALRSALPAGQPASGNTATSRRRRQRGACAPSRGGS